MDKYKIGHRFGTHTCRVTLMKGEFAGHITFEIGGNAGGMAILYTAMDYLSDPCKLESDCGFTYYEDDRYSFTLRKGENILPVDDIDFDDLCDMIVAVEIIDYKDEKDAD